MHDEFRMSELQEASESEDGMSFAEGAFLDHLARSDFRGVLAEIMTDPAFRDAIARPAPLYVDTVGVIRNTLQ